MTRGDEALGWAKPTGPAFGWSDDELRVPTLSNAHVMRSRGHGATRLCPPYKSDGTEMR